MFGEDRFTDCENFFLTYQNIGGIRLNPEEVREAILACYKGLSKDYVDPTKIDNFSSLREGFKKYSPNITDDEISYLEIVFTHHEKGEIPFKYADYLRKLSLSHKLGVVSNIWAKKEPWLMEFKRAQVHDIWSTIIFSSDSRSMKPSLKLFQEAINVFDCPLSDILFVGDNLRVDINPAKEIGLTTVWINSLKEKHPNADYVLSSLLELE